MLRIAQNIISRWYWLLILTTLLAGATVYWILEQQPALYRGSALLLVGPSTSSANPELNDLRTSGQLLETYAVLATTRPVLEDIIREFDLALRPDDLGKLIEITTTPETQILRVRVTNEDPELALGITNYLAERILNFSPLGPADAQETPYRAQILEQIGRLEARITDSEGLLDDLQQNLNAVTLPEERVRIMNDILQERGRLSTTEQFLVSLYDSLQRPATNRIEIIEPATEPFKIASQVMVQTIMGAVAGLVLGTIVAASFEYFNDTLMTPEDHALPADIPLLGALETARGGRRRVLLDLTQRSPRNRRKVEGYRKLATRVQELLWDLDSQPKFAPPKTVLVTVTPDGDDVSDVIGNLAKVLTQLGMRVLLIDANYDQQGVTYVFSLTDMPGLSDSLHTGSKPNRFSVNGTETLSVIPAGKTPSSSFALLASEGFDKMLNSLKPDADLLLIAAPALISSDTGVLASKVDASIVFTLKGKSRRNELHDGIENIDQKPIMVIFVDRLSRIRRIFKRLAR